MELDISHIMGLDGHVDDDLIDYDDDDVEISGTTWKTHQVLSDADQNLLENDENMQTNGEQVHSHPSTQTMADKPMSQTEEEIVVDHQETPDNDTFMSASHTVEAPTEEQGTTMSLSRAEVHDVTEILQPQPEVDDPNGNISLSEEQPADDKYEIDEIDYDDDGDDVANAPSANQASSHQTNDGELSQTQTNELPVVKETESPVHELDDRLAQAELAEHKDAPVESAKDEHDEEITWEDNGDELEISAIDQNPNTIVHTLSDQVNSKDQHHGMEDSGQPGGSVLNPNQESVEWDEERHDSDASRGVADESGENFQHENEQLEHPQSEAHDDLGEAQHDRYTDVENNSLNQHDDLHYPAVTVAYKGEEYPLISASADAFFSDLSIQDLTIKDMLAQFRDVLGEEITPTEELVFKIDELGLEFFEV